MSQLCNVTLSETTATESFGRLVLRFARKRLPGSSFKAETKSQHSNDNRIDPTLAEIAALYDQPKASAAGFRMASFKSYPFSFLKDHEKVEKLARDVADSKHYE